jgi:hypothetical protein
VLAPKARPATTSRQVCRKGDVLDTGAPACRSVRGKKLRIELLVYLHHLLASETATGAQFGDRLEVVILSARQGPVEHRPRRGADVLEAVHHVARNEDEGAGAGRRGLAADGQFKGTFDDEEYFFLIEMDVISRAFAGFDPPHENRDSATGGLGGKEYFYVEAERLDRQRLFGLDDGGLQR